MLVDKKDKDKLEKLVNKEISIEGRAAMLVESLSGIDPNNALNEILESVVSEDRIVKAAYKDLCRDISGELFTILTQINDRKIESVKLDVELLSKEKEKNKYCSIYAKVPPLQENQGDKEYQYFLQMYQAGTRLSQQISELNLKAINLIELQRSLDHAFAGSMIEMDYLIRRLNETMKTFRYMKSPDLLDTYKDKYCGFKDLQQMLKEKNEEFENARKKSFSTLNQAEIGSVKRESIDTAFKDV